MIIEFFKTYADQEYLNKTTHVAILVLSTHIKVV